jgi:hypothetical protein
MSNYQISMEERSYLRELAKKQHDIANLPMMETRKQLWYDHNSLMGKRPMVVIEAASFQGDLMPQLRCESGAAQELEYQLLVNIVNHELVDDDKVIPDFFAVNWQISRNQYGVEIHRNHADDGRGHEVGYQFIHPIKDLDRDFHLLKPSTFSVDREETLARKAFAEDVLGDILPVVIKNDSLHWEPAPSGKVVELMGLEAMMYAMIDSPEQLHRLFRYITDNIKAFVRWQEDEGLLVLNNGNNYTGAGSYGFTKELPTQAALQSGHISSKDLWGNMNSQETVSVSPAMFGEFAAPYYQELSEIFGLTYYGCCEPVDPIWKDYISKLHGLRKVSISPWCKEEFMGEALKGSGVIYSRKPSPNLFGIGAPLDEAAYAEHVKTTLLAAKGCKIEFICRDVYTLSGDLSKPKRIVGIIRDGIDRYYQ